MQANLAADKIIANQTALPFKWSWFLLLCIENTTSNVLLFLYQSITGTGVKAVQQLENEYAGVQGEMAYKYLFTATRFHCRFFRGQRIY
jgi:aspartate-semialdehyde dehydrogenase